MEERASTDAQVESSAHAAEVAGFSSFSPRQLTAEDLEKLKTQDSRIVNQFQKSKLEKQAKANWDKFYKRNETRLVKAGHLEKIKRLDGT